MLYYQFNPNSRYPDKQQRVSCYPRIHGSIGGYSMPQNLHWLLSVEMERVQLQPA
jgi:hypothetical protein